MTADRLAVLGHPIKHSRSPLLHEAAYRVLGLPWHYESADVRSADLGSFLAGLDTHWRGLSLTMPLKRTVLPLLAERDELVELIGVANTVLFQRGRAAVRLLGFNTDVAGAMETLRAAHAEVNAAWVFGSGATAVSVLVALARLGAHSATVLARSPQKAAGLVPLAHRIGLELAVGPLNGASAHASATGIPRLVISTLPGTADFSFRLPPTVLAESLLFDVAYDPWPTPLTADWAAAGGRSVSGLHLLVHQALRQVRIFVSGDPDAELDREDEVLTAMFERVGLRLPAEPQPS